MEQGQTPDRILNIEIDMISREHLKTITTWARIAAIIGLISVGLSLIRLLVNPNGTAALALIGALFFALIYFAILAILNIFLLRFANRTAASLNTQNQEQFNSGIGYLATYFKVLGIIIIVLLAAFALIVSVYLLGTSLR